MRATRTSLALLYVIAAGMVITTRPTLAATTPKLKIVDLSHQSVSVRPDDATLAEIIQSLKASMKPSDFVAWHPETKGGKSPHTGKAMMVVAQLKEVPDTYLVFFNYAKFMNAAFARASIYNENISSLAGDRPFIYQGLPVADARVLAADALTLVHGHDLTARHMAKFWEALDSAPTTYSNVRAKKKLASIQALEKQTRAFMEPLLRKNPNAALVVISLDSDVVGPGSHELSHAQFFNNPAYRAAIFEFWNDHITSEDREGIRKALDASGVYNVRGNEDLVINEMQAYFTQLRGDRYQISAYLDTYFWRLRTFLATKFPTGEFIPFINPHKIHLSPYCQTYFVAPVSAPRCENLFTPSCN